MAVRTPRMQRDLSLTLASSLSSECRAVLWLCSNDHVRHRSSGSIAWRYVPWRTVAAVVDHYRYVCIAISMEHSSGTGKCAQRADAECPCRPTLRACYEKARFPQFGLFIDPPFEESSMKAQLIARECIRVEQVASMVVAEVS